MGALDTLIGDAFGSVFGTDLLLGAAIFIFFAYISFRSGMSTSGIVFVGMLLLGVLTALSYIHFAVYGLVLAIGAWYFYRSAVAVSG